MATKTVKQRVVVDQREIDLTNLNKPLWPADGYTKADLIMYYHQVAPIILPHLKDRPLTLTRYPDGIDGKSFYQKNCPGYAPDWIRTYRALSETRPIDYILAEDAATLVWLANQACIEFHPWLHRYTTPAQPDLIVVDLDPNPPADFDDARQVAMFFKQFLDELGLVGFPKLSGATGIHIYIPIEPRYSYDDTSGFVKQLGEIICRYQPALATQERLVSRRGGRVYIDHLQNLPGKTIVAPYSLRPRPGAPVSMPVTWSELTTVKPTQFTIANALERINANGDLFAPLLELRQSIDVLVPS